jgi:hypothetical protein
MAVLKARHQNGRRSRTKLHTGQRSGPTRALTHALSLSFDTAIATR